MNPSDVLSHLPSVGQVVMPLVYTLQYLCEKTEYSVTSS
jgi:hypothetical protein